MKYFIPAKCLLFLLIFLLGAYPSNLLGQDSTDTGNVELGRKIYSGEVRLVNGGPGCISCHAISDPEMPVSGGTLAVDVTGFTGLPSDALKQRLMEIDFDHMAFMKAAYKDNPIIEKEAENIIAYLHHVNDSDAAEASPALAGVNFLWAGLLAFLFILGFIAIYWWNRKKGSVNKNIYKRQTQSV